MDKQEYLANTYKRLEMLIDEPAFKENLAQIRARAIQEELLPELPKVGFTFDAKQIWKYCDYVFSETALLLREDFGSRELLAEWIKSAAQTFEFLAKFAEEDEKETLLLNSAMCYHIAGHQANAQCLTKLVERNYLSGELVEVEGNTPDAILTNLFRHALVTFLRRDISKLYKLTTQALSRVRGLQETITKGIADGALPVIEMFSLTAHAYLQQALSDFVHYCLNGNPEHFSFACKNLQKSHRYFQKVGDATLGAITSELRTALDLFDEWSTWSSISEHASDLLEDRIWQVYLRNLAFDKSIAEFWLSQLKAIRSGLLTSEDSFVVQMPTSAGKTLIAELSILAALTSEERTRCLYIAPYRALASEIESNLAETLGAVGYRVSNLIGGFEFDAFQDFLLTESDVLVATPEKVELFWRTHPEYFQNLSVIVVDEGHIVDEGIPSLEELGEDETLRGKLDQRGTLGRGPLLELLITRLKCKLPNARFVFLSAVMPEVTASDFVAWLSKNRQEPLRIERSDRPSRQLIARFEWISEKNGELEYISLPQLPSGRFPFVPYFIQRTQYSTGEHTPTGRPQKRSWPDISNKAQSTAMLATRFAKTGPVLVFCAQTQHVRWIVSNVITSLRYLEASGQLPNAKLKYVEEPALESFHLALQWLGEEHPLTKALRHGVGLHYGPLPDPVRQAIEDEFRNEKIQILVSTNTLGQGVNMPVRTAIIYSLERTWSEEDGDDNSQVHRERVKKRDFWNICGRAGRAGKETEGQVVFVVTSERDEDLLEEYTEYANLEEIDSALYRLLQALVERRIDQDELIGYLDSHILAILAEEVVDTQDEAAIRDFLGTSLVGVQALRKGVDLAPLTAAIKKASTLVVNQVPDAALRQVFSSTGLRVRSCQSLEAAAELFLKNVTEDILEAEEEKTHYNADLLRAAFSACQNLPEMKLRNSISYYGPEDEFEIILSWIEGSPISKLWASFWVPNESEALSEYIADRITYKLPWGFNGFLRILAFKMGKKYEELPSAWQHLTSMIKFGVNNIVACWASSLGVSSRELALQLAAKYQPERGIAFPDFIKWMVNLPTEFVVYELEGYEFEKQRLLDNISKMIPDREYLDFIRSRALELESPVQGIRYEDRRIAASQVSEGDQLVLEAEPDNPYDPYAVRVIFEGKHIGYVQRAKARIISREMQLGREVWSYAKAVKPATDEYPFPWVQMAIRLG